MSGFSEAIRTERAFKIASGGKLEKQGFYPLAWGCVSFREDLEIALSNKILLHPVRDGFLEPIDRIFFMLHRLRPVPNAPYLFTRLFPL